MTMMDKKSVSLSRYYICGFVLSTLVIFCNADLDECSVTEQCDSNYFCGAITNSSDVKKCHSCLYCWFQEFENFNFGVYDGCDSCDTQNFLNNLDESGSDDCVGEVGEVGESTNCVTTTPTAPGDTTLAVTMESSDTTAGTTEALTAGSTGGTTADPNSCESKGKLTLGDKCVLRYDCIDGQSNGVACQCESSSCTDCTRRPGKPDRCKACAKNFFHYANDCFSSCPAGTSQLGRKQCTLAGVCVKGGIYQNGVKTTSSCACAQDSCQQCDFPEGERGGSKCFRCQAKKFLYDGMCINSCDEANNSSLVSYMPSRNGRECRLPFNCIDGLDENGDECICGKGCTSCNVNATTTCQKCDKTIKKYRYLSDGKCVNKCPSGQTQQLQSNGGMECKPTR